MASFLSRYLKHISFFVLIIAILYKYEIPDSPSNSKTLLIKKNSLLPYDKVQVYQLITNIDKFTGVCSFFFQRKNLILSLLVVSKCCSCWTYKSYCITSEKTRRWKISIDHEDSFDWFVDLFRSIEKRNHTLPRWDLIGINYSKNRSSSTVYILGEFLVTWNKFHWTEE